MIVSIVNLLIVSLTSAPLAGASGVPLTDLDPGESFQAGDFSIPVRYEIDSQQPASNCSANNDLLVTGIARVTGQVSCIKKAASACAEGTFADSLHATGGANGSLEYNCRAVARASCPTDYVWQKINLAQLDPGPSPSPALSCGGVGTCVYRWRNHIAWQKSIPPGLSSYTGTVCNPTIYNVDPGASSCSVVAYGYTPGTCTGYKCNSLGKNCVAYHYQVNASAWATPIVINGAQISCSVQKSEPCGSHIAMAYATGSGECIIKQPETSSPSPTCN